MRKLPLPNQQITGMSGSKLYVNAAGLLCTTNDNSDLTIRVEGFFGLNVSQNTLDKYVLKKEKYQIIRCIKKPVLRQKK